MQLLYHLMTSRGQASPNDASIKVKLFLIILRLCACPADTPPPPQNLTNYIRNDSETYKMLNLLLQFLSDT